MKGRDCLSMYLRPMQVASSGFTMIAWHIVRGKRASQVDNLYGIADGVYDADIVQV